MSFTKAFEPSTIPFGVYHFDHDYVKALKNTDDNVIDPEENDRYCGPVYSAVSERGPVAFFVPVDPSYESNDVFSTMFIDGIYGEIFDLRKMIPCVDKRFISTDSSNEHLISFCKSAKDDLEYYADYVMKANNPELR